MTLSPPVKYNLTTDRGRFKDAKRSLASGCSRCTHIITFSFLHWLCNKTALKTLQVGKPSILFLVERLLFFHHRKHTGLSDNALTHMLGHVAYQRQDGQLQSEPSLDLSSVFVIT